MKTKHWYLKTYSLSLVLLSVAMLALSCKDEEPTVQEKNLKLLTGTDWKAGSVTVNGTDQSTLFEDFTVNFTETTYTTANGDPVWAASGTWAFANDTGMKLTVDGSTEVTITVLNESSLTLSLTWNKTTFEEARNTSVAGLHVFTFSKN